MVIKDWESGVSQEECKNILLLLYKSVVLYFFGASHLQNTTCAGEMTSVTALGRYHNCDSPGTLHKSLYFHLLVSWAKKGEESGDKSAFCYTQLQRFTEVMM